MANNIDPLKNFSFKVMRQGGLAFLAGFLNVQGLSRTVDVIKYRTGSDGRFSRKLPGLVDFDPITFEQGIFVNNYDLWSLSERVFSISSAEKMTGTGGEITEENAVKEDLNVILTQANAQGKLTNIRAWTLTETWVSKFTISNFDAASSDIAKMTCVVECDYWQEVDPDNLSTPITAPF